jgi:hypothetical protein
MQICFATVNALISSLICFRSDPKSPEKSLLAAQGPFAQIPLRSKFVLPVFHGFATLTLTLVFVFRVRVRYALFVTWHFSSRPHPLNLNLSPLSFLLLPPSSNLSPPSDCNTAALQHRKTATCSELIFRIPRCLNFARAQPPSPKKSGNSGQPFSLDTAHHLVTTPLIGYNFPR